MQWRRALGRYSVVGLIVFAAAAPARAGGTPKEVIEAFHSTVVAVLEAGNDMTLEERYKRLMPRIRSTFDVPLMMRTATGAKWREATDAERGQLVDAYIRLSIFSYASHMGAYSGEQFRVVGEQDSQPPHHFVFARVVRANGDPIPLTYVMQRSGDEWRVIDVIVAGMISEMAMRRSEYSRIVNRDGVGKLAMQLNLVADRIMARKLAPAAATSKN